LNWLPNTRSDEAELVRRVRAGESSAFTEVVRRYRPRLLAFARRLLAGRSHAAEDVVQEALMRAHHALRRDMREVQLAPWLFVLTRNCCLDELSRLHSGPLMLDERERERMLVDRRSPEVIAEGRAGLREMLDGIATLPTEQRHALVRREVDGASYLQVADELGISTQATRALVHRARRSLVAYRAAAAGDVCVTAQADLLKAHRTGRRASHASHRHLLRCADCRAYRARLKALRRTLHALHPGPALVLASALAELGSPPRKLTGVMRGLSGGSRHRLGELAEHAEHGYARLAGASGKAAGAGADGRGLGGLAGGAASAKAAAGTAGVLAVLGAAALGGTLIIHPGQRSPLPLKTPAVPGRSLRAGARLPSGTAIVARRILLRHGQATVVLPCPAGYRVADLLSPANPAITAGYAGTTSPGASTTARVTLLGTSYAGGPLAVAVLCRRPQPDGALVPQAGASGARATPVAATCAQHALLLDRPRGRPVGTVSLAQPLWTLAQRGDWEQVRTEFHASGWLPDRAICSG
jgi:RNA polymerase sigma factor (sigma-70 family)